MTEPTEEHFELPQGKRQARKESRNILREALLLIPNFLKLLYRLLRDGRVPMAEKAFLVGAIAYVVSPLDVIPDVIPFIGQVDDLYLVALTMIRLLGRAPAIVIREHWEGPGDLVGVVDKIILAAQYVLPKRIQHILLGRLDIAPKLNGGLVSSPEQPADIEAEKVRRAVKER